MIKRMILLLWIIVSCPCLQAGAQVVSVSNLRQNVVYIGLDNPLRIVMEGVGCTSLRVSTDNGRIKKSGNCEYTFTPSQLGMAQIVINGGKKIYNYLLRVEPLPQPAAFLGGRTGGLLSKAELERQRSLYVRYPGIDIKSGLKISAYSYQIFRDDKSIAGRMVKGADFGRDMQQQFANTVRNDIILFYNIVVADEKGSTQFVAPIQFIIN